MTADRRQRAVEAVDEHLTAAVTEALRARAAAFGGLGRADEVTLAVDATLRALDAAIATVGRAQRHR